MSNIENAFTRLKKLTKISKQRLNLLNKDMEETIEFINTIITHCNGKQDTTNSFIIIVLSVELKGILEKLKEEGAVKHNLDIFPEFPDISDLSKLNEDLDLSYLYSEEYILFLNDIKEELDLLHDDIAIATTSHSKFDDNISYRGIKKPQFNDEFMDFIDLMSYEYTHRGLTGKDTALIVGNLIYINGAYCKSNPDDKNLRKEDKDNYIKALEYFNCDGSLKENININEFKEILTSIFRNCYDEKDFFITLFLMSLAVANNSAKEEQEVKKKRKLSKIQRHEALERLSLYYDGERIIKKCDIQIFNSILVTAEIDEQTKQKLTKLMIAYNYEEESKLSIINNENEHILYKKLLNKKDNSVAQYLLDELKTCEELYINASEEEKTEIRQMADDIFMRISMFLNPEEEYMLKKEYE